ncbi:MAG TPA: D-alanyl-D-alanine carboxypeptidase family protein [Kofleriaceae bacterium]|jgi:LAS superfamily LD-carboxypeptidase LdcB|nr:D-alanyl-D-alanine carboxypeptidase family protein [Kofleriaceae bacterium]
MRRLVVIFATLACVASAEARPAAGYVEGQKTTIKIVDVDGKDVETHTAKAFRVMQKAAHKAGVKLAIRSGFRSFKKQAELYKDYRRGRGNLAAPPGYSNHESGRALDLYVTDHHAYDWLREHAGTYGFHRTVPGEAWHWEYLGDETRTVARSRATVSRHSSAPAHAAPAPVAAAPVTDPEPAEPPPSAD